LKNTRTFPKSLKFESSSLNSITLERNRKKLLVYGSRKTVKADHVLITHGRRDLAGFARPSAEKANGAITPEASEEVLTNPAALWQAWWNDRFDYYGQEVTKWPVEAIPIERKVKDGDEIRWEGLTIKVLETPGYTGDMVSYVVEVDGKRVAFTGDLLWEGGRVFDIYSFQNAIPEALVGAYHGYGGRFGPWIESLRKIAAEKPDLIMPLRGPVITNPIEDIRKAIGRAQAIYENHLSSNALHWYFGEERLATCGEKVLGKGAKVELMPFCERAGLPGWCRHFGTTMLLVGQDLHGFALDVGERNAFEALKQAVADGSVKKIEGIWVTHTHNDHTAYVAEAAKQFGCPVYAIREVAEVLKKPGDWFLPGVSEQVVHEVVVLKDGASMRWKEFRFRTDFFPGQMHNHGALLVERPDHEPVYFIGDSFSPSGIDDYCLMNRNLMREDTGYLLCLGKIRALPKGSWLVNEHIPHLFRFSGKELDFLENTYRERIAMISGFVPWDDVNFALDEQWAWFHPYGTESKAGEKVELGLRIRNHSSAARKFWISLHDPTGREVCANSTQVGGRAEGFIVFPVSIPTEAKGGVHVYTASIRSKDIDLNHWCEAMIKVSE